MAKKATAAQPDLLAPDKIEVKPAATRKPKQEVATVLKAGAKTPAPIESGPVNVLQVIARAAADPKVDADKMRQLLDMQKEVLAEEARIAFVAAYRAMQRDLPVIRADGKIEIREKDATTKQRTGRVQQATPYATFQAIMKVTKPIMDRHGFTLSFATRPNEDGTRLIVIGYLDHDRGHQRSSEFPVPAEVSGSKNNVQGWGSSQSYGKRYVTIALLNIVSHAGEDRDTDGNAPDDVIDGQAVETLSSEQVQKLDAAIRDCGVAFEVFLKSWKIERLPDLAAESFDEAIKRCADYKRRMQEPRA